MNPHRFARGVVLLMSLCVFSTAVAQEDLQVDVEVKRVKPEDKLETLRFLKENRDFLRAQMDLLRQVARDSEGGASMLDPRYARFQELLTAIEAARDTTAETRVALEHGALMASVADLAELEARLDRMDAMLSDQRSRLLQVETDYRDQQNTALVILIQGTPKAGEVSGLTLTWDDGATHSVPFSAGDWQALERGGVARVYHELVEPREQTVSVKLTGQGWEGQQPWSMALDPARDQMTILQVDLSELSPADAELTWSTWVQ